MEYIESIIDNISKKKLVFWGAGRRMPGFIKEYCIDKKLLPMPDFICDSTRDIDEENIENIPVLAFNDLKKFDYDETIIVVTAGLLDLYAQVVPNELYYFPIYHCRSFEVYDFLKRNYDRYLNVIQMIDDSHSKNVYESVFKNLLDGSLWCQSIFEPFPYFGNNFVKKMDDNECLAFAGAFNGKHIERALSNNNRIKVHAFEPNKYWFEKLQEKYNENTSIHIHNKILWNKKAVLKFDTNESNFGLDAHVCETSDSTYNDLVESINLDSFKHEKPTYIVLDVEGSEAQVIDGARELIKQERPKLAICLYHQLNDFLDIPELITSIDVANQYKLYVKQHSCISAIETVLYAL